MLPKERHQTATGPIALALEDAVERWLSEFPNWLTRAPRMQTDQGLQEGSALWVGTAPTLRNGPEPEELEQTQRVVRKFDAAATERWDVWASREYFSTRGTR